MEINNYKLQNINKTRLDKKQDKTPSKPSEETKDYLNCPNPSDYIGRSQVIFTGKSKNISQNNHEYSQEELRPIVLKKNENLSKEDAKSFLKELHYTDDEIAQIDLNDTYNLTIISGIHSLWNLESFESSKENVLKDLDESSSEEKIELITKDMSSSIEYVNQENIDILKRYIDFDDDTVLEILEVLYKNNNLETNLANLPLIVEVDGRLSRENFEKLINQQSEKLDPERISILKQINDILPDDAKLSVDASHNLGQEDGLSQTNIKKYTELIEHFSQIAGIDISSMTPKDKEMTIANLIQQMETVKNNVNEYGIDITTNSDKLLELGDLTRLTNRDDMPAVKDYVEKLNSNAKYQGIKNIPLENSNLDLGKMAQLYNILYSEDYGTFDETSVFKYFNDHTDEIAEDMDGTIELIEAYKGTNKLKQGCVTRSLDIQNGDKTGVANVIRLKKELDEKNIYMSEEFFDNLVHNPEIDFQQLAKMLTYTSENDLKTWEYNYLYSDKNGYNKMVLKHNLGNCFYSDKDIQTLIEMGNKLQTEDEVNLVVELFNQNIQYDGRPARDFRWDLNNIYKVVERYREDNEATQTILNLKYDNGGYRFYTTDDILNGIDAYQLDKDLTLDMVNSKFYRGEDIKTLVESALIDKDYTKELMSREFGTKRKHTYTTEQIKNIVEASQIDKEFVDSLTKMTAETGYGGIEPRIHVSNDYKYFAEKYLEDKDLVKSLLFEKEDKYGKTIFKYSTDTLRAVFDNPIENRQYLIDKINEKENKYGREENKYSSYDIGQIAEATLIDKDLTDKLLNETFIYCKHEYPRFNINGVNQVVKAYALDKELTLDLLSRTTEHYDGELSPRFDAENIKYMVELSQDIGKEKILKYVNATRYDNWNNREVSRFEAGDITTLVTCEKKDPELVNILLNKKRNYSDGTSSYLYNANDIYYILEAISIDKDFTEYFLKRNDEIDSSLSLSGVSINSFITNSKENKELIYELLKIQDIDKNGRKSYRYDPYDMSVIASGNPNNNDFAIEIANMTIRNRRGNIRPRFSAEEIIQITNSENIDREFARELINLYKKNDTGEDVPVHSAQDIFNILKTLTYDEYKQYQHQFGKERIQQCSVADFNLLENFIEYKDITSVSELNKLEKKNLTLKLLINKKNISNNNISDLIAFIPQNDKEYAQMINRLTQSLNMSHEPLNEEEQAKFNEALTNLTNTIKTVDLSNLHDIQLSMPHTEFIKKVQNKIKDLPKEEQSKISDYFGFKIENNKLIGYPNNTQKDPSIVEITSSETIKELEKIRQIVDEYQNNNFILIKDNPELNKVLKELSKYMPEIFNQVDGSNNLINTLNSLQKVINNPKYETLSNSDKDVMVLATLLHNTDKSSGTTSESAFDGYFIAKRFNISEKQAQKIYTVIESSDLIEKFMKARKIETVRNYRGTQIVGQEKRDTFDLMAFKLKEGNNFELAQMLYTTKDKPDLTRNLDKLLEHRITEIKSNDFILPQTTKEEYIANSNEQTIERDGETYNVKVVNSSDINDFYAYIHTPEAGYATGGTRDANFANFEIFRNFTDDKVICTSYVTNKKAALVREFHNGFIFNVASDKQYVGFGTDIFSLAKNIPDMIVEYYRDNGLKANKNRGTKFFHRSMISEEIKKALYGSIDETTDKKYISRLENIKEQLNGDTMDFAKLENIDPEFAKVYREFFERVYTGNEPALMSNERHNEALVSNPEIIGIFTNDIEQIPTEYLIKAQEEDLPIVVIDYDQNNENK